MKKVLFHFIAACSFVVFVAFLTLTVRSYWYWDEWGLGSWKDRPKLSLWMFTGHTSRGELLLVVEWLHFFDESKSPNGVREYFENNFWTIDWSRNAREGYKPPEDFTETEPMKTFLGFGGHHEAILSLWKGHAEVSRTHVLMPLWTFVVVFAVLPTSWYIKYQRRRHRMRHGRCITCCYDLRASQDRCPECGTPIPPAPSATMKDERSSS